MIILKPSNYGRVRFNKSEILALQFDHSDEFLTLIGKTGRDLLICYNHGSSIEALEKAMNIPMRSGRPMLKLLAEVAVNYYGDKLEMIG